MNIPRHVHTNRELELMLAGTKPLAVFYEDISCLPDELIIPEIAFAPHVESGRFLRAEVILESSYIEKLGRYGQIMYVLFCLLTERLRIPAMLLLQEQFKKTGHWNQTLERIEGSLLGYTEKENNIWCADRFDDNGKTIFNISPYL